MKESNLYVILFKSYSIICLTYSSAPPKRNNVKITIEIRSESEAISAIRSRRKSRKFSSSPNESLANQGDLRWTNPTNQSGEYSAAGLPRLSAAAEARESISWEADFNQSCSLKSLFSQSCDQI